MKKHLTMLVMATAFAVTVFSPVVSYAQAAPDAHSQYIQALQSLIQLLEQQLQGLVAQMQSISDNQASIATQLTTIAQSTPVVAGSVASSTMGSMETTPTCELTAQLFSDSTGETKIKVTWNTTNAYDGGLDFPTYVSFTKAFSYNGEVVKNTAANGYILSAVNYDRDLIFAGAAVGDGGRVFCRMIVTKDVMNNYINNDTLQDVNATSTSLLDNRLTRDQIMDFEKGII